MCDIGPVQASEATLDESVRLAAIVFTLLSSALFAQTWRGSIAGTVLDASDARVGNVAVAVIGEATGSKRTVQSDARGEWTVSGLAPGAYRVEVEREGFVPAAETVTVTVQGTVRVDCGCGRDPVPIR